MANRRAAWQWGAAGAVLIALACAATFRSSVEGLAGDASTRLEQAADRLTGQLDRYRYLPTVLTRSELLSDVLAGRAAPEAANAYLRYVADVSGALDIYLMDATGTTLAASNAGTERSFVGISYAWRPYFRDAMTGALGYLHALGSVSDQRGFYFARRILSPEARALGVVAVKVDLEALEAAWRGDPDTVIFRDRRGVVFLSNRADLVFAADDPGIADLGDVRRLRQYPATLSAFPDFRARGLGEAALWLSSDPRIPWLSVAVTRPVNVVEMEATILMDATPALRDAALVGLVAALGLAAAALGAFGVAQRRRRLEERLASERALSLRLEERVAQKTRELTEAQDRLVQASKLSALGQMSAGISHELNQPLAAIQNFAENAGLFLERGETGTVRANLAEISGLTQRMDRIIRGLRAFARKEEPDLGRIDVGTAIAEAVRLVELRAKREGVAIDTDLAPGIEAIGGKVRLQQVLVNLLANAMDAMREGEKRIEVRLTGTQAGAEITVADTGPGLSEPSKVFEPFYTTKSVDQGYGLGLGLSISYGIVQTFGGELIAANRPGGGAEFTIRLRRAE